MLALRYLRISIDLLLFFIVHLLLLTANFSVNNNLSLFLLSLLLSIVLIYTLHANRAYMLSHPDHPLLQCVRVLRVACYHFLILFLILTFTSHDFGQLLLIVTPITTLFILLFFYYYSFFLGVLKYNINASTFQADVSHFKLSTSENSSFFTPYILLKRLWDFCIALLLCFVLFPLFITIIVCILLDNFGPPIFCQTRVGQHGKQFRMYKFRTMRCAAEPYALTPMDSSDCRITRVGRLLRRTSLDELPQLLNVLRGEMSLVGPRPEMPFITECYTPFQKQRFTVTPGMTGLWQISPHRNQAIHEHMEYDLFYIKHASFFFDLGIILLTPFFLFRGI